MCVFDQSVFEVDTFILMNDRKSARSEAASFSYSKKKKKEKQINICNFFSRRLSTILNKNNTGFILLSAK